MAKFPTEVESSVIARVPLERAYAFFWDVVGSSKCIGGLESCTPAGEDTFRFVYAPRSTGPVSLVVQYTSRYSGNGRDEIRFSSTSAAGDNTEVEGAIRMAPAADGQTSITLRQKLAPDTPVPRLLQGLVRPIVESEARAGVEQYLANAKLALES